MALLNYTTSIDADKSAQEISKCLSTHGAKAVLTEYDDAGEYVSAISFHLRVGEQQMSFRLPADWKPVLTIIENDSKVPRRLKTREQAVRISWRIIKDWVEAQMALVETRMVQTQDVFLPYAILPNGKTLLENIKENPQLLLQ